MNVGHIQQFVGSLATLFAAKTGNPQADMVALGDALDSFKELSLPAFTAFLLQAKGYKESGTIPIAGGKQKAPPRTTKAAKAPIKTTADTVAIQAAVDELESLYSHAADADLAYTTIEATVKRIHDEFDKDALKEVAKGFKLSSGLASKKGCREKIEHKIKERKARNERGEVIAAAAKSASSAEPNPTDDDLVEATVVENQ